MTEAEKSIFNPAGGEGAASDTAAGETAAPPDNNAPPSEHNDAITPPEADDAASGDSPPPPAGGEGAASDTAAGEDGKGNSTFRIYSFKLSALHYPIVLISKKEGEADTEYWMSYSPELGIMETEDISGSEMESLMPKVEESGGILKIRKGGKLPEEFSADQQFSFRLFRETVPQVKEILRQLETQRDLNFLLTAISIMPLASNPELVKVMKDRASAMVGELAIAAI